MHLTKPNLSLSIPKFEKMKERQLDFLGKPPQEALSIEPEKVAKGTLLQAHFRKKTDVIKFGKQLPRDNKMFYISETHNLDNPEQESSTSFFERINQFDNVKEAIRMIKRGQLMYPSHNEMQELNHIGNSIILFIILKLRINSDKNLLSHAFSSKSGLGTFGVPNNRYETVKTAQGKREGSKSAIQAARFDYKMSLEEKILAGYYKPLSKEKQELRAQGLYIEGMGTIYDL